MATLDTNIECVLFDLDGTLIDTVPDFIKVMDSLLAENNLAPVSPESVHQTVSDGARALVMLGFGIGEDAAEFPAHHQRLLELYYDQLANSESSLYPGMADLLGDLDDSDIKWGIVTNKPHLYSERLLQQLELLPRCKSLVCPDHVKARKPDPEPILLACSQLDCGTERTVYIGDHVRDIQAAKNADVIAVAAAYGYLHADSRVEEWYADFILQNPEQTRGLLELLKFS